MNLFTATLLGALAGLTIFAGLPVARMGWLPRRAQGFVNAMATGILVFLLWDILSHARSPIDAAMSGVGGGGAVRLAWLIVIFAGGVAAGLLGLVYLNGLLARLLRTREPTPGSGGRALSMMIASGLGLHNFSEGLAIGQSAAAGTLAFAGVLIVGFALHNVTEGFGIAAPLTLDAGRSSWGFLLLAGGIGGGPTIAGTMIGYQATSTYVYVLFLALAAGALIYVLNELFSLGRRVNTPRAMGWGLLVGFLAAFGTDLFLTRLAA